MADTKTSGLTAASDVASGDLIPVVDVSDTTQGAGGTTKKVTRSVLESNIVHQNLSGAGTNTHSQIDTHIANTSNPHSVTATQVGNTTAQWNANKIQGVDVSSTAPTSGQVLKYNGSQWAPGTDQTTTGGSGITSLNSQTGGSQTFANDTNVTMSSASDVHTLGWTGQLAVSRGGTGQSSYTDGQLLIGNTSTGGLSKATLTAGSNITITNGNGTITIASSGGGSGTPGGSNTQLQYNNSGAFGGISGATTNGTYVILTDARLIGTVRDTNSNEVFNITATTSAVNEFTVANAATGNAPVLSTSGGDTNIDLKLTPKGNGGVVLTQTVTGSNIADAEYAPIKTNYTFTNGATAFEYPSAFQGTITTAGSNRFQGGAYGQRIVANFAASARHDYAFGAYFQVNGQSTSQFDNVSAVKYQYNFQSSNTSTTVNLLHILGQKFNAITTTTTDFAFLKLENGGTGTVNATTWYGIYMPTPAGTTTATTAYGIYLPNINYGSTNYAIYTQGGKARFADTIELTSGNISLSDSVNLAMGTSTGTKIGTSTTQKIGFFNATPVVRQTGGAATASGTYGATEQTMLQTVYDALRTYGLLS